MGAREFDELWLPLNASFYRLAFYILENEDEAKDAVQDLYLNLWTSRDNLDEIANPLAYGLRILRNSCIDRLRSRRRHPSSPLEATERFSGRNPYERIEAREELSRLGPAIGRLPDKQRRLLKMRVYDGMDYGDIARETGLSSVNVRVSVAMARKTLKSILKSDQDERYR